LAQVQRQLGADRLRVLGMCSSMAQGEVPGKGGVFFFGRVLGGLRGRLAAALAFERLQRREGQRAIGG